jgi:exopolysaccharide biosynthesis polyprenyl glycosylphosphotransferase
MIWRPPHHKRIAQLIDGITTASSFAFAYFIWNWFRITTGISNPIQVSWKDTTGKLLAFSIIWVIIFTKQGAYSYQRFTSLKKEFLIVAKTTIIGVFIFFAALFLFRFGYIPRSYIITFGFINFLALSVEKTILFFIAKIIRKLGKNRKKIVVVGTGRRAKNFIETVKKNLGWGLDIIGLTTGDKTKLGRDFYGYRVIGCNDEIENILHKNTIDEVIICVSTDRFDQIRNILDICEREGVQVRLNSDFFGKTVKKVRVDQIYDISIISFITTPDNEFALYIKRIMDILISALLMIILSPLFLVIALLIKMTSKGPIFYQWNVVGLNKKPFKSLKFRTMIPNADAIKSDLAVFNIMKGPVFKLKRDPRITSIGNILRKFSLDELPQLWSVFKGDMSLVGPRPAGPLELKKYESWHRRKLSIKPGITCLWQISGRNEINDFNEWVKLDLEYIDNWSLSLDLKILLKTIPAVLRGTGI